MKPIYLACFIGLAGLVPAISHAAAPNAMGRHPMSAQQMTAMKAKLTQAENLVAQINRSYHTQFAVGPKDAMMAMHHMAMANMEMAKAMMEMQESWTASPSPMTFPTPKGQ